MSKSDRELVLRLERMEKAYWRLRRWVAVLLLLPLAIVVMGKDRGATNTIRAEGFALVDKAGNNRAWLGIDESNQAMLVFYGKNERTARFQVTAERSGQAFLSMNDSLGRHRVWLRVADREGAQVSLHDAGGRARLWLESLETGEPMVALADGQAEKRVELAVAKDRTCAIALMDPSGLDRVRVGTEKDGTAFLRVRDGKARVAAEIAADKAGGAEFTLKNSRGKTEFKAPR